MYETLLFMAWRVGCTVEGTEYLAPPKHQVLSTSLPRNAECVVQKWVECLGRKGLVSVQWLVPGIA